MNRLTIVWSFTAACLAMGCASGGSYAGSEDITYGTWSGTMTPAGAETIDISYLVKQEGARQSGWAVFGNTGQILLPAAGDEGEQQIDMSEIEFDGTTLAYTWTDPQGTRLNCALVKQTDTLLSGDCLDPNGVTKAQMTMSPPAGKLGGN